MAQFLIGNVKGPKGEKGESPTVNMRVEADALPAGADPTASIVNEGSAINADWLLSLGVPRGLQGERGPQGVPGPMYSHCIRVSRSTDVPCSVITISPNGSVTNAIGAISSFELSFVLYSTSPEPLNADTVIELLGKISADAMSGCVTGEIDGKTVRTPVAFRPISVYNVSGQAVQRFADDGTIINVCFVAAMGNASVSDTVAEI